MAAEEPQDSLKSTSAGSKFRFDTFYFALKVKNGTRPMKPKWKLSLFGGALICPAHNEALMTAAGVDRRVPSLLRCTGVSQRRRHLFRRGAPGSPLLRLCRSGGRMLLFSERRGDAPPICLLRSSLQSGETSSLSFDCS